MNTDLLTRIRAFLATPMPIKKTGFYRSVSQLILIFAVFYFAIFKYSVPFHEIVRGIVEFILVTFSLCSAYVIFRLAGILFFKLWEKQFTPCYGLLIPGFLAVYSCGMVILYPIKQWIWDIQKEWFWKYYWRHLPYAMLIFGVFLYREYKNSMIDKLICQLNLKLDDREKRVRITDRPGKKETPLLITEDGIVKTVMPSAISHISVNGHYLDLYHHINEKSEHICFRKPLKEILSELPMGTFLRIHRSHIVNPEYVSGLIKKDRRYSLTLCGGRFSIPISRNNLSSVLSFLENRLSVEG